MPPYRSTERAFSRYNENPGSGLGSGECPTAPPNTGYDFYAEDDERCVPVVTRSGAVYSEYRTMYDPTRDEYLRDVEKAKERGVPIGTVIEERVAANVRPRKMLRLLVTSRLHVDAEYGGPFWIDVADDARISEVKKLIGERVNILPGIIRLAYAGKKLDDHAKTLAQSGVRYWNEKFESWPLTILR